MSTDSTSATTARETTRQQNLARLSEALKKTFREVTNIEHFIADHKESSSESKEAWNGNLLTKLNLLINQANDYFLAGGFDSSSAGERGDVLNEQEKNELRQILLNFYNHKYDCQAPATI
jgi:hypothetical protein